ncbi:MAG: ATP-binding protein [Polyangia bacterium]
MSSGSARSAPPPNRGADRARAERRAAGPAGAGAWARLWALDAVFAAVELVVLVGGARQLQPAGSRLGSLGALAAGLSVLASVLWVVLLRRVRAPIYAATELRRAAASTSPNRSAAVRAGLRAGYRAATQLGVISLWGRAALGTATAALSALLGWWGLGLDARAALFLFWGSAVLGPHLSALCSLPHERLAQRWLDTLLQSAPSAALGDGAELRRQLDTYPGRLSQVCLITLGLGGVGALAVAAVLFRVPLTAVWGPGGVLPPLLLIGLLAWLAWLQARTASIEARVATLLEIRPGTGRGRQRSDGARALYGALTRLPFELAAAQLVVGLLPLLGALGGGALRLGRPTDEIARLLALGALPVLAGALYSLAWQTVILQPLWQLLAVSISSPMLGDEPPPPAGPLPSLRWASGAAVALMVSLLGVGLALPMLALAALAASGLAGVAWIVSRLVRPLTALRAQTVALARGELLPEPPPDRDAALAVAATLELPLQSALEKLRQSVRERLSASAQAQATLESEVAVRTAELRQRTAELEAALAQLASTQAELLRAEQLASIGRLIAGIAHEINNPVNAVINTARPLGELLDELEVALGATAAATAAASSEAVQPLLAEAVEMLAVLERAARRTHEIVRALREYSDGQTDSVEADSASEASEPVELHRVIEEAWQLVQDPIKERLEIERAYGELPTVPGLAGKLQQVVINLLSNALYAVRQRAAQEGERFRPRLRVETRVSDGYALLAVTDNGTGMPDEVRLRAFDPFFTTKDISDGSGLGLSIVHSIVRRHRGSVRVTSQLREGTTFTVALPLSAADPSAAQAARRTT